MSLTIDCLLYAVARRGCLCWAGCPALHEMLDIYWGDHSIMLLIMVRCNQWLSLICIYFANGLLDLLTLIIWRTGIWFWICLIFYREYWLFELIELFDYGIGFEYGFILLFSEIWGLALYVCFALIWHFGGINVVLPSFWFESLVY